jgi:hypothetical protein
MHDRRLGTQSHSRRRAELIASLLRRGFLRLGSIKIGKNQVHSCTMYFIAILGKLAVHLPLNTHVYKKYPGRG